MKTIEQAMEAACTCLAGVGIENARLESEFLVAACLHRPRTRLVLDRHQTLASREIRNLRGWLREREKRKPLAYVSGEQPFRDLMLKVNPSVLVPRPETELVVEQALRILDRASIPVTVVDVGTGSGNIALSLSKHRRTQLVLAIDCSARALRVAQANMKGVQLGAPVRWMRGDLLAPVLRSSMRAELIVANLPYVRTSEISELEPELRWEPRLALDGGKDGLRLIEPCIAQAPSVLAPGGHLLLEIGADQSKDVTGLLDMNDTWEDVRVFRDLAGLPRIVQARRKRT